MKYIFLTMSVLVIITGPVASKGVSVMFHPNLMATEFIFLSFCGPVSSPSPPITADIGNGAGQGGAFYCWLWCTVLSTQYSVLSTQYSVLHQNKYSTSITISRVVPKEMYRTELLQVQE